MPPTISAPTINHIKAAHTYTISPDIVLRARWKNKDIVELKAVDIKKQTLLQRLKNKAQFSRHKKEEALAATLFGKKRKITTAEAATTELGKKLYFGNQTKININTLTPIEGQKGSNSGKVYLDQSTGQTWYLKESLSPETARNEVLAAKLYQAAGVEVPEMALLQQNGITKVASKMVDNAVQNDDVVRSGDVSGLAENFIVDAWLANWDVAGLYYDNLLISEGRAIRIDTGGALRYRAMGESKGDFWGPTVGEIDSMRNQKINPQASAIFAHVTEADITAGAKKVLAIDESTIRDLVAHFGPEDSAEAEQLVSTLLARQANIRARYPEATATTGTLKPVDLPKSTSALEEVKAQVTAQEKSEWQPMPPPAPRSKLPWKKTERPVQGPMLVLDSSYNHWVTNDEEMIVYRQDNRSPEEIVKAGGFQPRKLLFSSLEHHISINHEDAPGHFLLGGAISTTHQAYTEIGFGRYEYKIRLRPGQGIDANKTAEKASFKPICPWEQEITVPGPISIEQIEGFKVYDDPLEKKKKK